MCLARALIVVAQGLVFSASRCLAMGSGPHPHVAFGIPAPPANSSWNESVGLWPVAVMVAFLGGLILMGLLLCAFQWKRRS